MSRTEHRRVRTPRCATRALAGSVVLASLMTEHTGCVPIDGGACPDSGDRLDESVLGPQGADYGSQCDALCPGDVPLGSVEGTVAVVCTWGTCEQSAWYAFPQCAFAADLEAWKAEKCPECRLAPHRRLEEEPSYATCAYAYDYLDVRCDPNK